MSGMIINLKAVFDPGINSAALYPSIEPNEIVMIRKTITHGFKPGSLPGLKSAVNKRIYGNKTQVAKSKISRIDF